MNLDLSIEPFAGMKTMLAAMLAGMAAEMAEWQRAAGGSITKVAVTLAGKAAAGAVNFWCACWCPFATCVRPSPTKSDQKNMNMTRNGKITRLPEPYPCHRNANGCAVDFCARRGMRRVAYPLWIWQRLTTKSLRKKTRQTLRFYGMVTAKKIREELNQRLEPGANGGEWLKWLNSLPEVQALVAAAFGGWPVSRQSLSEWRQHGYQRWLWPRQARERAPARTGRIPTMFSTSASLNRSESEDHGVFSLSAISSFFILPSSFTLRGAVVAVRRGDHRATRLQMASERLEAKRREISGEFLEVP